MSFPGTGLCRRVGRRGRRRVLPSTPRPAGPAARPSAHPRRRTPAHSPAGSPGRATGQGVHRGLLVAAGGQRQRPQRADLDDAACPALGGRRHEHSFHERKRLSRAVLGEQHPGQHQIRRLAGVIRLVVRAKVSAFAHWAAALTSPWASSSRARCDGTGLSRAITCGLSSTCPASPIASRAAAASPCACRIRATTARPVASGEVRASCRHSGPPGWRGQGRRPARPARTRPRPGPRAPCPCPVSSIRSRDAVGLRRGRMAVIHRPAGWPR